MSNRPASNLLFDSPSVKFGEEAPLKRKDFYFDRKLGEGAFGQVWKVKHRETEEIFALKQVAKDKVAKIIPQFKREVFLLYNLDHEHIIKLFNHFEDDKFFYLVMEFVEGGTLFSKLHKERQFMELEAAQFFRETVAAVEFLHSHVPAIIHRDIKPENIMLDKSGRVILTDFGWSNFFIEQSDPRKTVCGTLEYLPPEIIEGKEQDTSVDIWCLGVLLYEMLVGYSPFKSKTKNLLLSNIKKGKPEFPLNFPLLAKELVLKMLTKSQGERLTIQEVKNHKWLQDNPPTKPLIHKTPERVALPQYHESIPVEFKTYKVINPSSKLESEEDSISAKSDSDDLSLSYSDMSMSDIAPVDDLEDMVCKESVMQIQAQVNDKQAQNASVKANLAEVEESCAEVLKDAQSLELRVEQKEQELKLLNTKCAQLQTDLEDSAMTFANYNFASEDDELSQKIHELRKEIGEKQAQGTILKKKAQSALDQHADAASRLIEREEMLGSLKQKLGELKMAGKGNDQNSFDQINDLEITRDILSARIKKKDSNVSELGEEDSFIIREATQLVDNRIGELSEFKMSDSRALLRKLHDQIFDKERMITELKIEFEEKRSEVIRDTRREKDKISENKKQMARDALAQNERKIQEFKEVLQNKLKETRLQETLDAVVEAGKNNFQTSFYDSRKSLRGLNNKVQKLRNERNRLRQILQSVLDKIDTVTMELNDVKIEVALQEELMN